METRKRQTNDRTNDLNEAYILALLQRATRQDDHKSRAEFVQHFGETMRGWLQLHPLWKTACSYGSEEHYLSLTFERLRQSAIRQLMACKTLTEAYTILRVSLNTVLLVTLRAHQRAAAVPEPVKGLLSMETSQEFWEGLRRLLPDDCEQQLVYLLYHCGLRPTEIVALYPQEWSDVQEIIHRRAIILMTLQSAL
jgi:hypothetical protein